VIAAFLSLALFGTLFVWATYAVGARFGARVGWTSALVVAASPVFLFQLLQPMGDEPVAALWMLATAGVTSARGRGPVFGGAAAAAGILIRPSLAPLAVPLALFLLLRPERTWGERRRTTAIFAASAVAGALIRYAFSGSAFSSGDESLDTLFSADHIVPNAVRYASWLSQTQTPIWVLAAAAPFLLPGALTRLFLGMFFVNLACYLPYVVVNDWWSLRFLLPTIPLVMILVMASIDSACRRVVPWTARPVLFVAAVVLAGLGLGEAEARGVLRLQAVAESRINDW
jgi:hypothetical protein